MVKVSYVAADGTKTTIEGAPGAASEVTPASRLSCRIRLTPELDGLVVHLPDAQF